MKRTVSTILLLIITTVNGCVTKSTYDEVMADLEAIKAEITRAKEQSQTLSQEAAELERLKADLARQFETAAIALQQAKHNIEDEQAAAHRQLSQLAHRLNQLSAQQNSLRLALQRARDEEPTLQESVESFKVRLAETNGPRASAFPAVATPADIVATPTSTPVPGSSGAQPAPVAVSSVATQPDQPPAKPALPAAPVQEATDEGFFAAIRNWILSLWRSIFS